MLWFNEDKDLGKIQAEDGVLLAVAPRYGIDILLPPP